MRKRDLFHSCILFLILCFSFLTGCSATRKFTVKDKKLPKLPYKIAVINDGVSGAPIIKEILTDTNSFKDVVLIKKSSSAEDTAFRQMAYDQGVHLFYIYEVIPLPTSDAVRIMENLNEGAATLARGALGLVGSIATAPVGGIGGSVSGRGVDRLWPYGHAEKVRVNFWIEDVYTGETIYSNFAITTGSAMRMGFQKGTGGAMEHQGTSSELARHNAFVKSTIDLIKNISRDGDAYLHIDEDNGNLENFEQPENEEIPLKPEE